MWGGVRSHRSQIASRDRTGSHVQHCGAHAASLDALTKPVHD
jgi:hypothetical protein